MTPYFQNDLVTIYHGNCFDILPSIRNVDLIFTDPPYWTLNKWRNVGTTTRLGGHRDVEKQSGWFTTIDQEELWKLMCECYRLLSKDRHCCIMSDGQTLRHVLGYYEEADFSYAKPIIWDKVKPGMGYHLRCRHEFIVLMDKGKNRKPKDLGMADIITIPMVTGGYPTEKPAALPDVFIQQYTEPGELVLDPFMGAGSTVIAAHSAGRRAIGIDVSQEACDITISRLKGTGGLFE